MLTEDSARIRGFQLKTTIGIVESALEGPSAEIEITCLEATDDESVVRKITQR